VWCESEYDQHMGVDLLKSFILISTIFLYALTGCAKGQDSMVLTKLRAEQTISGVVIARKNYQQLEMLAVTQELNAERILVPITAVIADSTASEENVGEWASSCDSKICTISNRKTGATQTIDAGGIIVPPQWSPDGKLAFFIRQVKGFRLPIRCSLEDERDLIVYDPTNQSQVRATVLCGGYPYSSLRWYKITH
jgi:hypothetical protein